MARKRAPWMLESDRIDAEYRARDKAAEVARGSRVIAVLPWRADARYNGADVIRWFKRRADADKFALKINGGQGVAVRDWKMIHDPDATPPPRSDAEIAREVAEAAARYR